MTAVKVIRKEASESLGEDSDVVMVPLVKKANEIIAKLMGVSQPYK